MMISNEEHNDEIGNNHIATNTQNPIRTDAFEISDEEKNSILDLSVFARSSNDFVTLIVTSMVSNGFAR